jgi:kynureninase
MPTDPLADEAAQRDQSDPLRSFRERFYLPPNQIYLDGNSLGLLSRDAEQETLRALAQWRDLAIGGWMDAAPPWFFLAEELAKEVAPFVGADAESVIVTGGTTVNLHQLLATLYHPELRRKTILTDSLAFPSDIYAIESHLHLRGVNPKQHLRKIYSPDGFVLSPTEILADMANDVQMIVLPSVLYVSGQLLDMAAITAAARARDIVMLWDLSHSIGAIPHALDRIGADGAFWCHYKYLNAGPGAVGGLYLNRRHHEKRAGLAGWFGSAKEKQFTMSHTFSPALGAGRLQIGTPPILSMAPLLGSLRLHQDAGIEAIREKSLALTDFLRRCAAERLAEFGVTFALPENTPQGGHLALIHPDARPLSMALRRAGVISDFRPPDIIRLAPVPLYNSFSECLTAMDTLRLLLERNDYERDEDAVTLVP